MSQANKKLIRFSHDVWERLQRDNTESLGHQDRRILRSSDYEENVLLIGNIFVPPVLIKSLESDISTLQKYYKVKRTKISIERLTQVDKWSPRKQITAICITSNNRNRIYLKSSMGGTSTVTWNATKQIIKIDDMKLTRIVSEKTLLASSEYLWIERIQWTNINL